MTIAENVLMFIAGWTAFKVWRFFALIFVRRNEPAHAALLRKIEQRVDDERVEYANRNPSKAMR